jgi:hypothetical protein
VSGPEGTVTAAVPRVGEWVAASFDATGPGLPDGRSAPLTYGQRALWMAFQHRGREQVLISLRRGLPMPRRASSDVASVLQALSKLMLRHDSLRTRLRTVDGEHLQVVAGSGELPVQLIRVGDDDPAEIAGAVALVTEQLAGVAFDHAEEWPQRIALVLTGDQVRHIVVVFSHTTVDFQAAEIVLRDLRVLLTRGSIAAPAGFQSADVAASENTDHHRRRAQRVAAHWVNGYGRLPKDTIPVAGPALTPRFQRAVLVSAAADTAIRMIAIEHRVTSTTVLLTAAVAVLSRWSGDNGNDVVGIYTMVNNRAHDGYADAIAKLNQLGLMVVDVADRPSFAELLPRTWQVALGAYRHAYYDPGMIAAVFAEAGFPYGVGVNPHSYLNDIRLSTDTDLFGRATGEADLRSALEKSTLTWSEGLHQFTWRTRLEIVDMPGALGLALTADTGHLPPESIERFLRDLDRLLTEAACRDVPWPWI